MTIALKFGPVTLAMFGMLVAFVAPCFAQTVSLTSNLYVVSESDGRPLVQIVLDQPAGTTVTASYSYQAGTAEFQSDFYVAEGVMIWAPGQSGPRRVDVFITDDQVVESDEEFTFFVKTVEGAELGSPSLATIRIIDDDSDDLPDAKFFNPDDPEEPTAFVTEPGQLWEVGIRLSRIPEAPLRVHWESAAAPGAHSTSFDGVREQVVLIRAPTNTSTVGWPIDILPDGLAPPVDPDLRSGNLLSVESYGPNWQGSCVACVFLYLLHVLEGRGCVIECIDPACLENTASPAKQSNTVEVLRRYRDEILASTATGQFYSDLYDQIGPELGWLAFHNLDIVRLLPDMEATWVPAFEGLVDGHGDAYYIVGPMQAQLSQLFDALESAATGDLAATLAFERGRLELDSVDGLNMDELQAQLEAKGGLSAQSMTWGTLKARYSGH